MKKKIVQLITQLELGGAQKNTLATARHQIEKGYEVVLISSEGLLLKEAEKIENIKIVLLKTLVRPISPFKDIVTLFKLILVFLQEKPHLVHTHSSKAGILGRIAGFLTATPTIHTIHGFGITPLQHPFLRTILILLERLCALFSRKLIAVSRENVKQGLQWGIGIKEQYQVIRSGVSFGYRPTRSREQLLPQEFQKGPLVGTISCLKPQKNPFAFLKMIRLLPENVKAVWVGGGELEEEFLNKAREENLLGTRLHYVGWDFAPRDYLYCLDCFVLVSLWEGLPRALLEAYDAGVPMVASAVDGNKEVVFEGETGYLIPPDDIAGFANAVTRILERKLQFQKRVKRVCEQFIVKEFSIEKMLDDLEKLTEQMFEE